jgi:replicative DNA helicase
VIHDHNAERMVISAVVHSGDLRCWEQAHAALDAEYFHHPAHRRIWEACERVARTSPSAIDSQLVLGELHTDHAEAFLEATGRISIPRTLPDYIRRVRDLATMREVGRVCGEIYAKTREGTEDIQDFLDDVPRLVADALRGRMLSTPGHDIRDVVEKVYLEAQAMVEHNGLLGVTTGLRALDAATLGYVPGDLVVIAGRPGMGKSALAQHNIQAAAAEGKRVLVFSLEMPKEQWTQRILAADGKLGLKNVRTGKSLRDSPSKYLASCERVSSLPIRLVDIAGMNHSTLSASARAYAQDVGKVGLIVVDYLQLMLGDKRISREQQVAESSRACKLLARELDCPVVLLSQLNREAAKRGGRPQLSDLRESGAIEQDADMVLFVHRPGELDLEDESLQGFSELILGKCRNGATGIVHAAWTGEHTLFGDLPMGWKPPEGRAPTPRRRAGGYS